jgi:hypothetical protein
VNIYRDSRGKYSTILDKYCYLSAFTDSEDEENITPRDPKPNKLQPNQYIGRYVVHDNRINI